MVLQAPPAAGLASVALHLALLARLTRDGQRALSFGSAALAPVGLVGTRALAAAPVVVLIVGRGRVLRQLRIVWTDIGLYAVVGTGQVHGGWRKCVDCD